MTTLSTYLKTRRLKLSHAKTVTAAFHLHNREAKRELKVYANGKLLPFFPVPIYLGIKLNRSLMFRHHLETLCKKLATCATLLRRLAGSEWSSGAKTLRTAALSLVYSTVECYVPAWCPLIDNVLNDALRIITRCLRPTPTATRQSFEASSQLSFAAWERHSPWPCVAPWTQTIFYTVN